MDGDAEKVMRLLTSLAEGTDTTSPPLASMLSALADNDYNVAAALAGLNHDN